MATAAKNVIFSGTVQGIGFRFTVSRIATRYDLAGYVKNLPDGSVEMLVQGENSEIECLVEDVKDSFKGYIRGCKINPVPFNPGLVEFEIAF